MDTLTLRPWLRAAGISDDELRRALRDGDLSLLRRGAYVRGPLPEFADDRHRLLVRAAREQLVPHAVVSHVSAALLHGLDLWRTPLERVHVTRARPYGGRRGERVHVHVAPLAADEIVELDGALVTGVARTVVDVARVLPFEQAVVVADAALHRDLVEPAELDAALGRVKGWPGAPAARRAVWFADGRSDGVGESRSRVRLAAHGLAPVELQFPVVLPGGRVALTDFAWPDHRTVAEFDGQVKYGRYLRPGEDPGEAVFREKRREDAIRGEDLAVVRWTWHDLDDFAPTAAQVRRTLGSRTP